nr:sulfatase [Rhizobium sp. Q54]
MTEHIDKKLRTPERGRAGDHGWKGGSGRSAWRRIAIAFTVMAAILDLPSRLADFSFSGWLGIPLELPAIALAALLLPRAGFAILRPAVVSILILLLLLKLADLGTQAAFQRPFNPYLDLKIISDGWDLLSRSIGRTEAALALAAGIAACLLIAATLFRSLAGFRQIPAQASRVLAAAMAGTLLLGCVILLLPPSIPRVSADALPLLLSRVSMIRQSMADLAEFQHELATDPLAALPPQQLFSKLEGTDVLFIFVESYGRSALSDQRYAGSIRKRLAQMEASAAAAGLEARSGWLTSPTVSGLSWLAHGALLSGLWTDSQLRYDRMTASLRPTINALFRRAGWRTTAIMPAITMAWPESAYFGYDRVRDAEGLGYRGKPFNWVTMPDQYTLSAFERLERSGRSGPVMAQIALISSHAPWTPVPQMIDWDDVGDGSIFDEQALAGEPPAVLWADPGRVRQHYLACLDYVLETLSSYIERHGRNTLMVIVGDHQPAAIITGEDASRDVPIHIIGPPAAIEHTASWDWQRGTLPDDDRPPLPMSEFRPLFVRTFSGSG